MAALALRYAAAFAAAALAAWAVLVATGLTTLRVPGTTVPAAYALAPLAGLAVFQLGFGALTGRWRGAAFWAAALPLTAAVGGLALAAALVRLVTLETAMVSAAAVLFAFGLWAALGMRGGGAAR
ncbi:MAG: hypothetical protein ACK4TB_10210 [Gemmobacter sp.]